MADNFINTVIYCKMQMQFRKVVVIKITKNQNKNCVEQTT